MNTSLDDRLCNRKDEISHAGSHGDTRQGVLTGYDWAETDAQKRVPKEQFGQPMQAQPTTLTDRVRRWTAQLTQRAGMAVHRAGIHPDLITIVGLLVVIAAAVPIAQGQHTLGAIILILGLPLDALDGAVARAMGRTGHFGGVLDSTLDRYADGLIFGALAYYFAMHGDWIYMLLTMAALNGSFVVSYVRARAGEAGLSVKVGWFSRLERLVVLLVMLLIPPLLIVGLVVLAVGTNISVLQRLWYTRGHLD